MGKKYIDADELLKEASKDGAYGYVSAEQIADFPAADVQEVKHGRWKPYLNEGLIVKCSVCGSRYAEPWHYCPNCGASMRG